VTPIDISFEGKTSGPWTRLALLAAMSLAFALAFDVWDSARTGHLQARAELEERREKVLEKVRRAQASHEQKELQRARQEDYPWQRVFSQFESSAEHGISLSSATHDRISGRTRLALRSQTLEQLEKTVRSLTSLHPGWKLERIEIVDTGPSEVAYEATVVADRSFARTEP
jgi:hypothetical protein